MSATWLLVVYCGAILLSSLAGGWIPMLVRLTHTRMQLAMSFIGGAMLGVGLLHLLPHAFFKLRSIDRSVAWMLAGFLLMFFIERVFHFHHHDAPVDEAEAAACNHDHDHEGHDHDHAGHAHDHAHHHGHSHGDKPLTWQAALVGLLLHSTLDGVALAAAVAADTQSGHGGVLAGLGVFLVVVLHKPFDSMTLGALMAMAGKPARLRHMVNAGYALAIPAGVLLFNLGAASWGAAADGFIGASLAFAAGTFLCIATSDLLPELQFHSHDRVKLSAALLVGLALAWAIVFLEESGHDHSPVDNTPTNAASDSHGQGDGHHGHDH